MKSSHCGKLKRPTKRKFKEREDRERDSSWWWRASSRGLCSKTIHVAARAPAKFRAANAVFPLVEAFFVYRNTLRYETDSIGEVRILALAQLNAASKEAVENLFHFISDTEHLLKIKFLSEELADSRSLTFAAAKQSFQLQVISTPEEKADFLKLFFAIIGTSTSLLFLRIC